MVRAFLTQFLNLVHPYNFILSLKRSWKQLNLSKRRDCKIITVDPWTTWVWTAFVHLYAIFFSVNTTVPYDLQLVGAMHVEPWIQTDHGNWASLNFGIQDRSWNQSPSDTDGQVYSRHPFSLLQLCSEWEGMTFLGGLWKPLPQSTVNILSRFLVPWKSFIPMMLFLFSLTQSPVLQEKKFSCWKQ